MNSDLLDLTQQPAQHEVPPLPRTDNLKITLISLHGLIRATIPNWAAMRTRAGRSSTCWNWLANWRRKPNVREVELLTRQIIDPKVDDDYAQLEEPISDNAKIVRIPFGPKRYLRKESLWPYIEMFVDQTLAHFNAHGLPDIIHGHYADAGLAGAQLARSAAHSVCLYRAFAGPRQAATAVDWARRTRIAGEEVQIHDSDRSRRNRLGNGVDGRHQHQPGSPAAVRAVRSLCAVADGSDSAGCRSVSFSPPTDDDWQRPRSPTILACFLRDPDKPMILTMARPDERKNLEMLVRSTAKASNCRSWPIW